MARSQRAKPSPKPARTARLIAVASGKGGVGKTLVSASLALALSRHGKTVLVDADLGGANAHTALGMAPPARGLSDVVRGDLTLAQAVSETPAPGLHIVSGARDPFDVANLKYNDKRRLVRQLSKLDADDVVVDLGAGTSFNTLDLFLRAHVGIVVVLPEPTSVENAHRFIKASFVRAFHTAAKRAKLRTCADIAGSVVRGEGDATPHALLRRIHTAAPGEVEAARTLMAGFRPLVLLNQVRAGDAFESDLRVGHDLVRAARRFAGFDVALLGEVPYDERVSAAIRARQPLMHVDEGSPARDALGRIASRVHAAMRDGRDVPLGGAL